MFKVGDKVKLNQKYFNEGLELFGCNLKYPRDKKHIFKIKRIVEIKNPETYNLVYVDGGKYKEIPYIAECFLQLVY